MINDWFIEQHKTCDTQENNTNRIIITCNMQHHFETLEEEHIQKNEIMVEEKFLPIVGALILFSFIGTAFRYLLILLYNYQDAEIPPITYPQFLGGNFFFFL